MSSSVQQQFEPNPATGRPTWREAAADFLHYSGGVSLVRAISRRYVFGSDAGGTAKKRWHKVEGPRFAILCYHRVGTGGIPLFSDLPPAIFEAQVRFLRRHYRIVSLTQLRDEIERPVTPRQSVAITFDDGYRDLYFQALPILKKYKIPATVFLPVASIERNEPLWYDRIFLLFAVYPGDRVEVQCDQPKSFALPHQRARIEAAATVIGWLRTLSEDRRKQECEKLERLAELPQEMLKDRMLTWAQIREMQAGGVEFGAHTLTHPVVSRLTQEQLEHEIVDSKRILEARIEERVQHFAFPFGKAADCGTAAFPVIAKAGFRSASTTEDGINGPGSDLLALNRVSLGEERHLPMFALKMAQLFLTSSVRKTPAGRPENVGALTAGEGAYAQASRTSATVSER